MKMVEGRSAITGNPVFLCDGCIKDCAAAVAEYEEVEE